jgi:competence ComEA-like helix-hairpin-helix protein
MAWRDPALRVPLSLWLLVFLSAAANAEKKKPPLKPVNINTATSEELQQVPGIGPATAQKILQMRKSYGPFKSVDDLLAIRGLGQKRLDKMRKYLTVGKTSEPKSRCSTRRRGLQGSGAAASTCNAAIYSPSRLVRT